MRQVRSRGVPEAALRHQLATVPTPRLRRFVFVRHVTLRAGPQQVAQAMQAALAKLSENDRQEVVAFADFPDLVVACARAALGGGLGGAWHWRTLGLSRGAGPGQAIATLLTTHPLEAVSAVSALAEQGLLGSVWRDMPEAAAARLTAALAIAAGFTVPDWPADTLAGRAAGPRRALVATPPTSVEVLLGLTVAMWAQAGPWRPHSEALMAAAVLSLLRWSPGVLRSADSPAWPVLLARIAGEGPIAHTPRSEPVSVAPSPRAATPVDDAAPPPTVPATWEVTQDARGQEVSTGWGGVLFLINALRRLDVEELLKEAGPDAPSGWRLLHDLGMAFGLPEDEPMAVFLAAQDLDTTVPSQLLATLVGRIEDLYRLDGPLPLPLAQPARLWATETHLDLDLETKDVDPAIRLAGLDLDPGWVPWLGRVVTFHYDQIPTHYRGSG
ncbi:MAG TPA: hypothetical protein VKI44_21500 [Acetobacteraceae bacterium]|nr:hypothetical protein [Acetobacteraceae bacterium]